MGIKTYLDQVKERAMIFLVSYPHMNVSDRNFFELLVALPDLYELDGCLTEREVKTILDKTREEIRQQRLKTDGDVEV